MNDRLHLLMHPQALRACLDHHQDGEPLILLDRGVELLTQPGLQWPATTVALRADLEARGLEEVAARNKVSTLEDAGWVSLVEQHPLVLSWK